MSAARSALYTLLDQEYSTDGLARLLADGADLEERSGPEAERPLFVATRRRRVDAIHALAEAGARVDAPGPYGLTAFQHAVRRGFDDCAEALRQRGSAGALSDRDRYAQHLLAGEVEAARAAAAAMDGPPVDLSNAGEARLLPDLAARSDRLAETRELIELGVPLDAPGLDGGSALHQAAWFGEPDGVALLLEYDPPLELLCREHRYTPLGWCAHGSSCSGGADSREPRYVRIAELLLAAGASLRHPLLPDDTRGAWLIRDASPAVGAALRAAADAREGPAPA